MSNVSRETLGLLVRALACYRLSRMFALEDGPMGIFRQSRFQAQKLAYRYLIGHPTAYLATIEGVACPLCISFWVSLALYPLNFYKAMAVSAFASIAYMIEYKINPFGG